MKWGTHSAYSITSRNILSRCSGKPFNRSSQVTNYDCAINYSYFDRAHGLENTNFQFGLCWGGHILKCHSISVITCEKNWFSNEMNE